MQDFRGPRPFVKISAILHSAFQEATDIDSVHNSKGFRHSQALTNRCIEPIRIGCENTLGEALLQMRSHAFFKLPQLRLLQDPHLFGTYNQHDLIPYAHRLPTIQPRTPPFPKHS